jgi:HAD superfamily hydrolase (TIGR01509 family)
MNTFNAKQLELVIFDMDGLMFDTEKVSCRSFTEAMKFHGYDLDEATFRKTLGCNLQKAKKIYQERFGEDLPFEAVIQKKFAYSDHYIQEKGVPIKEGLYELLDFLCEHKIKKAVATSSNREVALNLLKMAGIDHKFEYVLCGDEIEHSKPDPGIFLRVAEKLNCHADRCIVLEDSEMGILAAHRAGMRAIMIPDMVKANKETKKLLFKEMKSLLEVKQYLTEQQYYSKAL